MKKSILTLLLIIGLTTVQAKHININTAKRAGISFLKQRTKTNLKSLRTFQLTPILLPEVENSINLKSQSLDSTLYVFDINQGDGFIIISGDSNATPILGYSLNTSYQPEHIPDAMNEMLLQYQKEINQISRDQLSNIENQEKWNTLTSAEPKESATTLSNIAPLITTKWNQGTYYNAQCPVNGKGQHAITGCIATAMAQVMKFHNHPTKGQGYHSYTANNFGLQNINFFQHEYTWAQMPNTLNAENSSEELNAVAKLLHHCGVSVSMNYGTGASGSTMNRMANALKAYFSYNESLHIKYIQNFDLNTWIDSLHNELTQHRPILYAGFGNSSGHAFILDGYQFSGEHMFHINWGWGGYNDGYFALTALNPGAFPNGFNYYQHAVFGVEPDPAYSTLNLELTQKIELSSDTLYTKSPYEISTNLINKSTRDFQGTFEACFFKSDSSYMAYAGSKPNMTLLSGDSLPSKLIFSQNYLSLPAGKYLLALLYKEAQNNSMLIEKGAFDNFIPVVVSTSDSASNFELNDSIILNNPYPVHKDSLQIHLKLKNRSLNTFTGKLKVKIYTNWGYLKTVLDSIDVDHISPDSTFTLTIFIDTLQIEQGSYLLSISECPNNSINEYQVSAGSYTNPISLTVLPTPPKGDKYEMNDSLQFATFLECNMSTNYFYQRYDSLSIHTDKDNDFYFMIMPSGAFKYEAFISVYTNNERDKETGMQNNENEGSLSFSCYDGKNWQGPYTEYNANPILIDADDTMYVNIFPYFTGLTGDYSFSLYLKRTVLTAQNTSTNNTVSIYPNPCHDFLITENTDIVKSMHIFNDQGIEIQQDILNVNTISTQNWNTGTYFILINYKDGRQKYSKIMKY